MRSILLSLFCSLYWMSGVHAQAPKIERILKAPVKRVEHYTAPDPALRQLYLRMDFGDSMVLNQEELRKLKGMEVLFVEVVYTDYPQGANLVPLNRGRLLQLAKQRPGLYKNPAINWSVVCQDGFNSKAGAAKLFHGIVISYRPDQSGLKGVAEIAYLDSALLFPKRIIGPDSVVSRVLNRNEWNNMLIVADVTGSMSPYTAQLLLWLRLRLDGRTIRQLVFFNDGDLKPDRSKQIGFTGGVYPIKSQSYEEVELFVKKVMARGNGGDLQENDLEAVLKGISLCKDCAEVILIADNLAPVRDMVLLSQIKKPVRVILCGAEGGINTQYLDIARKTGGSVHTLSNDITNLMSLKEGDTVTFGGQSFRIEKGKFVKISGV